MRAGDVDPVETTTAALARTSHLDRELHAFAALRPAADVLADAERLRARSDLADLPLAGAPVGVKDDLDVAGLPTRKGSLATPTDPAIADDELVRRLRDAGALVIGKTAVPEFMIHPVGDTLGFAVPLNPWDRTRTTGGSSAGSGTAVASGMVPVAIGSDGLGSIRIPSACCGVLGLKPGPGVVPRPAQGVGWFGMDEHGPMATTVEDASLVLAVIAGRPDLAAPRPPERPLRVALSMRSPAIGVRVDRDTVGAVRDTADTLRSAGHAVVERDPPYPSDLTLRIARRWFTAPLADVAGLRRELMGRRTRSHLRLGRLLERLAPVPDDELDEFGAAVAAWFADVDVLLSPVLARSPMRVGALEGRSVGAATAIVSQHVIHTQVWNLLRYPAASVPGGIDRSGLPIGVQIVGPPGREATVLSVASQLETLRPWPRVATGYPPYT